MFDNNMLAVLAEVFATITLGAIIVGINYPGAFIQGANVRWTIFLGSNCPGGNNAGDNHQGGSCQGGGNYPGGNFAWGQLPGGQ